MRRRGTLLVGGSIALALATAGVVAIPLGGWDTVALESARIPELAAGESYHGRHYSVRVEEAWVGAVMPDDYDVPDDGMTFLVVRAVVRNEWREPDGAITGLLSFDALDGLPRLARGAQVRVAADGSFSSSMPPGVETEVLLRWELPAGSVAAGEPLVLGVLDGRPEAAVLYSGTAWRDEHVAVQATVVPHPSEELVYPWRG